MVITSDCLIDLLQLGYQGHSKKTCCSEVLSKTERYISYALLFGPIFGGVVLLAEATAPPSGLRQSRVRTDPESGLASPNHTASLWGLVLG